MSASGGGRFVAWAGLTVLGVALGAFTAITFWPQVGAGIGITARLPRRGWRLMGLDIRATGIDVEALKNRFYPSPDHRNQQGDARVATETDAARDRVLAARAALGEELEALEASARTAIDVPAKIKRSPAKAAALAGGTAFLVLGGPRRVVPRGQAGGLRARRRRCPSRCSPRRSRRPCASSATTATRCAARSSVTSRRTRSRRATRPRRGPGRCCC